MLAYHALLRHRHRPLAVLSVVVYLMHDPPAVPVPRGVRAGQLTFDYEVFCPWERLIGPEQVREHPPLAPLAALTPAIEADDLEELRAAVERTPGLSTRARDELLTLTFFIAGRRFPADLLTSVQWRRAVEESSTYRYVMEKGRAEGRAAGLEEGRAAGLRRAILDLVAARVEIVPDGIEQRLAALDADRLHGLLLQVANEEELLALIEGD